MRVLGFADVSKILHLVVDKSPDGETGAGDAYQRRGEEGEEEEAEPGEIQSNFVAAVNPDEMQRLIDGGRGGGERSGRGRGRKGQIQRHFVIDLAIINSPLRPC